MPISGRAYRKQVSEDIQFLCWDIQLHRATAIVSGRRSPHCCAFWLAIGSGKERVFKMKTEEADQTPPYDSADHLKISVAEKTNPPILSTFTAESDSGAIKQDAAAEEPASQMTRGKMINTFIICLLQLLNFMDRYALPGNKLPQNKQMSDFNSTLDFD